MADVTARNSGTGKKSVNPFKSMSFKMVLIFFVLILIVVGVSVYLSSRTARVTMEDVYSNYTKNVAEAGASGQNGLFASPDDENALVAELAADPENEEVKNKVSEQLKGVLGDVLLFGVSHQSPALNILHARYHREKMTAHLCFT